jgi:hypothetical protein
MRRASVSIRCDLCGRRVPITWTYVTPNTALTAEEAERKGVPWFESPEWAVCSDCDGIVIGLDIPSRKLEKLVAFNHECSESTMVAGLGMGDEVLAEVMETVRQQQRSILTIFWECWTERHPEPGYMIKVDS